MNFSDWDQINIKNPQDFSDWDQIELEDQWSKDADSIFDIEDPDAPLVDDEGFIIVDLE